MMRWFTRSWASGRVTDDAAERAVADAGRALDALIRRAPARLRPLFSQVDPRLRLDDARIETVEAPEPSSVVIGLVQGELATGYGLLTLTFLEAVLTGLSLDAVRELAGRSRTEVWYFEFDLHGERSQATFEVRFLLHPEGEFGIRFRDAHWIWKPRKRRRVYRRGRRE